MRGKERERAGGGEREIKERRVRERGTEGR
jgi:hypothetical protein